MSELARLQDWTGEGGASGPVNRLADANRRTLDFMFGAQKIFLEEVVFATNEMLDRTRTETHLFAEFVSKLAASHSVRDWRSMYADCTQHQLDFIRRDCERLFKHGQRMIETTASLMNPKG